MELPSKQMTSTHAEACNKAPIPFLTIGAVALSLGISALAFLTAHDAKSKADAHALISVGMPESDLRERMGEPIDVFQPSDEFDPANVSGFTPSIEREGDVWTFKKYWYWVYVYFDGNKNVKAVYFCGV